MPDISQTLGGFDIEHWEPQGQSPEGTMSNTKYGLVNDGNLCFATSDKREVVFCHRNHVDRCGCACAAFQITEDKDGKKVAVLHCFPEPREIDVEFEIQEDSAAIEREHRESLLRAMTTEGHRMAAEMLRPGDMVPRDTGLPSMEYNRNGEVLRTDGDGTGPGNHPQVEGNNGGG